MGEMLKNLSVSKSLPYCLCVRYALLASIGMSGLRVCEKCA